jgi:hypothetical protein
MLTPLKYPSMYLAPDQNFHVIILKSSSSTCEFQLTTGPLKSNDVSLDAEFFTYMFSTASCSFLSLHKYDF